MVDRHVTRTADPAGPARPSDGGREPAVAEAAQQMTTGEDADGKDRAARDARRIGRKLLHRRPDYAERVLRKVLESHPDWHAVRAELILARRYQADWSDYDAEAAWFCRAVREGFKIAPLALTWLSSVGEDLLLQAARRDAPPPAAERPVHRLAALRDAKKIRLGHLSAEYGRHPVGFLIRELLERIDRSAFEVIAYDIGKNDGTKQREDYLAACDGVVDLSALSDRDAADRIAADAVGILIDLNGHTGGARPGILARRPAPVQVSYLAYPGTLGAPYMDYIVGDAVVLPMERQACYDERIVQVPYCYQPNDSRRHQHGAAPERAALGLPEGFVFCCFNTVQKIGPKMFDAWMRLLRAVPDSVLWLLARGRAVDNLRQAAVERGVAAERIVFAPWLAMPEHLARLPCADLFLDTLPYNAHTLAADSLWEGLPVLTCLGETFAGRVGASLLTAAGLSEFIAHSLDEYEAMALDLVRHPERLAAARRHLQSRTAPLFDMTRQARDVGTAYRMMWQRWCDGLPPAPFAVPAS